MQRITLDFNSTAPKNTNDIIYILFKDSCDLFDSIGHFFKIVCTNNNSTVKNVHYYTPFY